MAERHEVFWPSTTLVEEKGRNGSTPASSWAIRSAQLYHWNTPWETFSSNCTPVVTLEGCLCHSQLKTSFRSVFDMYSCRRPLFCISPKCQITSWLWYPYHRKMVPGSLRTGCLWQCQREEPGLEYRGLSHRHYTGFTAAPEHPKISTGTADISVWVEVGYCLFLLTLKSMLSLTCQLLWLLFSPHCSRELTAPYLSILKLLYPPKIFTVFPSFWDFFAQNNVHISLFEITNKKLICDLSPLLENKWRL